MRQGAFAILYRVGVRLLGVATYIKYTASRSLFKVGITLFGVFHIVKSVDGVIELGL